VKIEENLRGTEKNTMGRIKGKTREDGYKISTNGPVLIKIKAMKVKSGKNRKS
jgi:hypothetical protein